MRRCIPQVCILKNYKEEAFINTKTAPLLSGHRRKFIVSAAGIIVAGLAAASPLSLLSRLDQGSVCFGLAAPTPKRLYLDLPEAKRVASQFVAEGNESVHGHDYLDLAAYASASLDALDHLASIEASFVGLGFEWLDPAMANQLARWKSYFLVLDNLGELTPKVTRILNTSNHALVFSNLKHLDIEAAEYLVDDDGHHPLDIHISGMLSLPLAKVLSRHPHELYLSVFSLEPQAAKALSRHHGYSLSVTSKAPFSEDVLRAFSGNAMRHLTTRSGVNGFFGSEEIGYTLDWNADLCCQS